MNFLYIETVIATIINNDFMRYSKQRELIYNAVTANHIHPTAETVYSMLKKDHPNLSLGTVYRNLQFLSERGDIKRLTFRNMPERYDGNMEHHYHGVCQNCGEVVDIFIDYLNNIDDRVSAKYGIKILSHDITFSVICPKCAGKTA